MDNWTIKIIGEIAVLAGAAGLLYTAIRFLVENL